MFDTNVIDVPDLVMEHRNHKHRTENETVHGYNIHCITNSNTVTVAIDIHTILKCDSEQSGWFKADNFVIITLKIMKLRPKIVTY